ncbi:hypothetical protein [Methanococcus voltae]|uniref:Uncharacterized protein n=1 Tax=Methanococcus voltae (strain ATCC BAA-1334 / A3) TaxID=456320 RepID=D7DTP5_METV3|nr:hypothetical protein [Methanococcus voltae]MCS3901359.1 hypothetical protein [Methanococcus voltae]
MNTFEIVAGLSAVFIVALLLIGMVLQIFLTYLGVKIAKMDSDMTLITKVSIIKFFVGIVFAYVPLGVILSYVMNFYINKEFFKTTYKNGFIIEIPSLILGIILIAIVIGLSIADGQNIYSATYELLY